MMAVDGCQLMVDGCQPAGSHCQPSAIGHQLVSLGVPLDRLVTDSRAVTPGDTFVAYPGGQADGRQFIAQAIANGANAVIWEAQGFSWNDAWQIPNLAVSDLRHHAGEIACHVYGNPSGKLWMVGVTGTNGKTSCSHWIAQSLCALGKKTALVGTLGNGFSGALQPTLNTTPDAVRLHGLLADYLAQGAQAVAMEVSSHALEQGRVNGVKFDVALLTNLSRDHLDYHGNMSRYAAAKRRLFDWRQLKYAVLNLDDTFGAELASQLHLQDGRRLDPGSSAATLPQQDAQVEVVGYGLSDAALKLAERFGLRMVYGGALQMDAQGIRLQVHSSWGGATLRSPLVGRFNAENLLGALAVLLVSGVTLADALHKLEQAQAVPGRMQTFGGSGRPAVVVDYAHTPDALEKVLQALREVAGACGGKLICVFGCGGDRDRGKRPMMGTVAAKLADRCIVTSDNPRSETPRDIIAAIAGGMHGRAYQIIEDRAEAIALAIREAQATDTVLLAGKGHEPYQEIKGIKYPFSDAEAAQRALEMWMPREVQDMRSTQA
jgi:UDP-N-acetylmuramoyl-L-alanyl-D-glutamate--2,6-diaminopimelate ligase